MVLSMERWVNKVAIVTGASAGIGAAIVTNLVKNGMIVAGLARRKDKVEQIAKGLEGLKGQLHAVRCDVSNEKDILDAFEWVSAHLGPVHVLVNNAGIIQNTSLYDGDTEMWRKVIETNIMGLCIATREAIRIMKTHNINGHIIHINSAAGHSVPQTPNFNIYPATKHAVTALAETLRFELAEKNSSIKITSISPGATATDIVKANGMENTKINDIFTRRKVLEGEDIADAVGYALSTPPHVQIKELTIKPVQEKV